MAYLANFEEDVFISYAHNDDDTYSLEPKGWVAQLHHDLEQRVKVHLGSKPSLWRDCQIRNNEDFEKKILKRLINTATFLSIISPSFVKREWCIRELQEFAAHAEQSFGIRIDDDHKFRIFKVEKVEVDPSILPSWLRGSGSYKFYGPDPHSGRVHEFRPKLGSEYGIRYFEQMDELSRDIAAVLRGLAQKSEAAPAVKTPALSVYLAETTPDLIDQANEIRRDLKSRGYGVLPLSDLPTQAKQFSVAVREYLKQSVISIHLVGSEYGAVPDGEKDKSKAWLQNDLASERANGGNFMRLVWMASNLQPPDGRQESFIQHLLNDPQSQKGADILQTKLEDLKTVLHERLGEVCSARERIPRSGPQLSPTKANTIPRGNVANDPIRIYVICGQSDSESASLLALKKHLFSQGYEPILPSSNDDEKEALLEHNDNLALCDAALIYYGQGSEKWFNAKLMDFRKVLSRREQPVLAKAVYLASPETSSKSRLETHEAMILRGVEPFSGEALTGFLNRLRKSEHAHG